MRRRRDAALVAAQLVDLPFEACGAKRAGEKPGCDATRKRNEYDDDERRLPLRDIEEPQCRLLAVLQRKIEQCEKDYGDGDPADDGHRKTSSGNAPASRGHLWFLFGGLLAEVHALAQFLA